MKLLSILLVCLSLTLGMSASTPPLQSEASRLSDFATPDQTNHYITARYTQARDLDAKWRAVKSLAEEEVAAPSASFIRPEFSTKRVGRSVVLTITKGNIGDLGFGGDPYKSPIRKQILIEALRRALADVRLGKLSGTDESADSHTSSVESTKWQCYLEQAEQLVKQMVVAIETVKDKSHLDDFLGSGERQVDDIIYNKLYDAVDQYAQENKYTLVYDRGQVKPFSVSISSNPTGAKVWRMTDIVYRKQLKFSVDPTQWPWEEVVQNPAYMIGKYRYMAHWQDGRRAEGSIDITSANPLTFRPQ